MLVIHLPSGYQAAQHEFEDQKRLHQPKRRPVIERCILRISSKPILKAWFNGNSQSYLQFQTVSEYVLANIDACPGTDTNLLAKSEIDLPTHAENRERVLFLPAQPSHKVTERFEVLGVGEKTGHVYNACPLVPRSGTIMFKADFEALAQELRGTLKGLPEHSPQHVYLEEFYDYLLAAFQTNKRNTALCALESKGSPPAAPSKVMLQGPHYAEGQARGASVTAVFQICLAPGERELVDLALVRVWQSAKELIVDLVVSVDRSSVDDSSSDSSGEGEAFGKQLDHPVMLFGSRHPPGYRTFSLFKLDEASVSCDNPAEAVLNWSSQERSLQVFSPNSLEYASLSFKPVLNAFKRSIDQGVDFDLSDSSDRIRHQKHGLSQQLESANPRVVLDEGQLLELDCREKLKVKAIKLRQKL